MTGENYRGSIAIGVGVFVATGIAVSAFAASVVTSESNAGQGVSVNDGYNVANVHFTSPAEPEGSEAADIDGVKFNIYLGDTTALPVPQSGHTVFARLNDDGNWMACPVGVGGEADCGGQSAPISEVTSVEIVAYKSV